VTENAPLFTQLLAYMSQSQSSLTYPTEPRCSTCGVIVQEYWC